MAVQAPNNNLPNSGPEIKADAPTFRALSEDERKDYNQFHQNLQAGSPEWRILVNKEQATVHGSIAETIFNPEKGVVDWEQLKKSYKGIIGRFEMLVYENKERRAPAYLLNANTLKELISYDPGTHSIEDDSKFYRMQNNLLVGIKKVFVTEHPEPSVDPTKSSTEEPIKRSRIKGPGNSINDAASSLGLLGNIINYGDMNRTAVEGAVSCHVPVAMLALAKALDNQCKQETGKWLTSDRGDTERLAATLLIMSYEKYLVDQKISGPDSDLTMVVLNQVDWIMRSNEKKLSDQDPAKILQFAVNTHSVSAQGCLNSLLFHAYGRGQSVLLYDNSREVSKGSPSFDNHSWKGNAMDNPLQIFEYQLRHHERSIPGLPDSIYRRQFKSGIRCLLSFSAAGVPNLKTATDLRNKNYDNALPLRAKILIPDVILATQSWNRQESGLARMVSALDSPTEQDTFHMTKFPRDGKRPFIHIDTYNAAREESIEDLLCQRYKDVMSAVVKHMTDKSATDTFPVLEVQKCLEHLLVLIPKIPGMPDPQEFFNLVGKSYEERSKGIVSEVTKLDKEDQKAYVVLFSYLILNRLQEMDNTIKGLEDSTPKNQISKKLNDCFLDSDYLASLKEERKEFFDAVKASFQALLKGKEPRDSEEVINPEISKKIKEEYRNKLTVLQNKILGTLPASPVIDTETVVVESGDPTGDKSVNVDTKKSQNEASGGLPPIPQDILDKQVMASLARVFAKLSSEGE